MLARASSDAGTRLRRSKSTSTVHRHPPPGVESLDLDVAQQHAIAAATAAFARSQAHDSAERKGTRSIELVRRKSTTSRKSLTSQGSHFPPREFGARSVPPQNSTQTTGAHRLSVGSAPTWEKFPSLEPTPGSDKLTPSTCPLSAQSSAALSEYGRPASQPKSHRQSAASSITSQQIRKARSMYYASSVQTGSPIARPPAKYLTTPPPIGTTPALGTAPTAYVPTRRIGPSPLAGTRVPITVATNVAVEGAREQYVQDLQARSVKHKPSMFLAPFKKRQDRSKDKSKRVSSMITSAQSTSFQFADDTAVDITVSDFMPHTAPKDRRSFSGSLKKKIKKVFRRTSNKPPSLPVQQIEASREYFRTTDTAKPTTGDHGDIPSPDEELLQRVRCRSPSLDGGCPRVMKSASSGSSKGSTRSDRSLHSDAKASHASASRVTSWGTSASGETLTQRAIKRLTVIHEAKDSVGSISESALTRRKSLPLPAFSAFKDPMHMESLAEEATTPPVDPKRVFSALMREIDASKAAAAPIDLSDRTPGAESDVFESSKTKELHLTSRETRSRASRDLGITANSEQKLSAHRPASAAARSVQSKKGSIRTFGQAIKSTIRAVTPGEHRSSPCLDQPACTHVDANTPSSTDSSRSRSDQEGRTTTFKGLRIFKKKGDWTIGDASIGTSTPTAEQIELRVARAKSRWQTPLDESATPQFPRETDRLYTVVNFSQQRPPNQESPAGDQVVSPQSQAMQLSKAMQSPMSPSVYSRNTDGASILPNDSVISFNNPYEYEHIHHGGSAVILKSQSVRSYVIGTPSPNRPNSTRSSRDWKAWLSHEVSGIEATSQEDIAIHEQYATPSRQHKLDLTQTIRTSHTGSEDTTVIVRESFEASTPRAQPEQPILSNVLDHGRGHLSEDAAAEITPDPKGVHAQPDKLKDIPKDQMHHLNSSESEQLLSVPNILTPHVRRDRAMSTPSSSSSAPQHSLGTPGSARMNDRFPYLDTGRRSSSHTSSHSHQSKSPTSSVGSSLRSPETTPGPKVIYSDMSAPTSTPITAHEPNTALRRNEVPQKSKENITPPLMGGRKRPNISHLGLITRPKSLQPLSSTVLNRNSTTMTQYTASGAEASLRKGTSSPVETVANRPSLRVIIRPLSPEKLSQRPRSAFDLRNTPSPRPASELRRPALQPKASSRLLSHGNESSSSIEASSYDIGATDQRDGSATPGQRMAERFLKARKSATVLERGVRNSASKLTREDTPAFL